MLDVRDAMMIGTKTDGAPVRRPLSPHIGVYRPQLTSVLSIMNRISGIASSVGTLLMVWWLVASAGSPGGFATMQGFMGSFIGILLLFGWTVAMMYHFFGGLRHLAWDAGLGFDLPKVYASGWAAVAATAICTVLIWVVALMVWH
jgi:succinate dehydrogenase / fumarate reductase cytochrome b subunit